jgi:hypothetical protein
LKNPPLKKKCVTKIKSNGLSSGFNFLTNFNANLRNLTQIYQNNENLNNDDDDEVIPTNLDMNNMNDNTDPHRLVMAPTNENMILNRINDFSYQRNNLCLEINKKPFSCPKCERTFNSKYNVARHLRQFHAEKRMFKCLVCGRDYKWIDSLHKHAKSHNIMNTNSDLKTNLNLCRENEVDIKDKNTIYSYVTLTNDNDVDDNDDDDDSLRVEHDKDKDKDKQTTLIDLSNDDSKTC